MIRTIPPAVVYGLFAAAAVAATFRSGACGSSGSIQRSMTCCGFVASGFEIRSADLMNVMTRFCRNDRS